jgi:uncharacterized membrane protein YhaH (DUF805 family)
VDFIDWYVRRGRITRRTWWLHYTAAFVVLSLLATTADASMGYPGFVLPENPSGVYERVGGPFSLLIGLFTLVPSISSSVARLHDRGHSAWWLLWMVVPVVGWAVLLVQNGFLRGDGGPNRYGPAPGQLDPLNVAAQPEGWG